MFLRQKIKTSAIFKKNNFLNNNNITVSNHLLRKKKSRNNVYLFYKKLIGLILKNGKKSRAIFILNNSLRNVKKKLNISVLKILSRLMLKLTTSVEFKRIRKRRKFHFVPFPVNFNRSLFLSCKWLLLAVSKNKKKKNKIYKLSFELIRILRNKPSVALKMRRYTVSKSILNRSNAHFRW